VMAWGAVAGASPLAAGAMALAASIVGRSGGLWIAVALPPARSDGLAATAGQLSRPSFAVGTAFALILLFLLGGPVAGVVGLGVALVLAVLVIAGWTALCRRLVGGQSGDLIGALGALVEIAVLTGLLLFAPGS